MNTQKRIDLTVEFTKNPRFSHAPEAAPKDTQTGGDLFPQTQVVAIP
jgi:hypothetical protein